MAPGLKRKSNYKSDDFVASDDDDTAKPAKKGKTGRSDFTPLLQPQTDSNGEKYWEISKVRRVTVSDFKGNSMINIREYYEKDGQHLPGKKGISMTIDQYSALLQILPQIEEILSSKGVQVPRPSYDGAVPDPMVDGDDQVGHGEVEDDRKANIEATSDEDE